MNGKLYILDEPTAALDPLAEAKIYQNFNEVVGGNSVIYISHRLSSTKFCDKIITETEISYKYLGRFKNGGI